MQDYQQQFIQLALAHQALRFGEFTLKSGRTSPYFFNAGQFHSGSALAELGRCYAAALVASGIEFDMLFGPAYKGIPLVSSIAIALARDWTRCAVVLQPQRSQSARRRRFSGWRPPAGQGGDCG